MRFFFQFTTYGWTFSSNAYSYKVSKAKKNKKNGRQKASFGIFLDFEKNKALQTFANCLSLKLVIDSNSSKLIDVLDNRVIYTGENKTRLK